LALNFSGPIFDLSAQKLHFSAPADTLSAQTLHLSAQSDDLSAQSDNLSAQSDNLSAQSDDLSAPADTLSAQSETLSAQTLHLSAKKLHSSSYLLCLQTRFEKPYLICCTVFTVKESQVGTSSATDNCCMYAASASQNGTCSDLLSFIVICCICKSDRSIFASEIFDFLAASASQIENLLLLIIVVCMLRLPARLERLASAFHFLNLQPLQTGLKHLLANKPHSRFEL
jgi:hypothetical protein